jgi:hypothetical protein
MVISQWDEVSSRSNNTIITEVYILKTFFLCVEMWWDGSREEGFIRWQVWVKGRRVYRRGRMAGMGKGKKKPGGRRRGGVR